jgi:hypothetical protein
LVNDPLDSLELPLKAGLQPVDPDPWMRESLDDVTYYWSLVAVPLRQLEV